MDKNQGSNSEIKNFCEVNFNINFPMTTKIDVKGENIDPIYKWAHRKLRKKSYHLNGIFTKF